MCSCCPDLTALAQLGLSLRVQLLSGLDGTGTAGSVAPWAAVCPDLTALAQLGLLLRGTAGSVSGDVAGHISCTIVRTNGNHDLLDSRIAGACADDVGQLCYSCTSKCSYIGVACGVNTSSGDVFETGDPNYQLTAGVGQSENWGREQAGPAVVAGGYRILLLTRVRCRCMTGRGGRWWWVLTGGGIVSGGVSAIVYCCVNSLTC